MMVIPMILGFVSLHAHCYHRRIGLLVGVLLGAVCLLSSACSTRSQPQASAGGPSQPRVVCVHYPLGFLVREIAGDYFDILLPESETGRSPADWRPDSETLGRIQTSDLILLNGAGYAKWVSTVSLPPSKLRNTGRSFADQLLLRPNVLVHRHGPEGEHAHQGYASLTWLDLSYMARQGDAVCEALVSVATDRETEFRSKWQQLRGTLETLDAEFLAQRPALAQSHIVATHPGYEYWLRRYGQQHSLVDLADSTRFSDDQIRQIQELRSDGVQVLLVFPKPPTSEMRDQCSEQNWSWIILETCEAQPDEGDFLQVFRGNLEQLRGALPVPR